MPTLHCDDLPERYADMPVFGNEDGGYQDPSFSFDRCIRFLQMQTPVLDEIWDITAEVHVTNEILRARGLGLHLTSEILIGPTTGNSRFVDGVPMVPVLRANGTFNVGVEAHHGLICRHTFFEWTQDKLDAISSYQSIYIKLMIWAGCTQAISGDRCVITPGRGQLKCLRFLPL